MRLVVVAVVAGVLYLPSLQGLPTWDNARPDLGRFHRWREVDDGLLPPPLPGNYYRPIVSASFYMDHRIGVRVRFFCHQTNILIHVLGAVAVAWLLDAALRSRRAGFLGGLLFAVQPVQVSAVAWIGGRTDSLCALWMAIFGGAIIRGACAQGRKRAGFLALAAVFFALAVFTKEQVLPAILLVPLAFRCWGQERGGELRRTAMRATIPFVGIAVAFVVLYLTFGPERTHLGGDPRRTWCWPSRGPPATTPLRSSFRRLAGSHAEPGPVRRPRRLDLPIAVAMLGAAGVSSSGCCEWRRKRPGSWPGSC